MKRFWMPEALLDLKRGPIYMTYDSKKRYPPFGHKHSSESIFKYV